MGLGRSRTDIRGTAKVEASNVDSCILYTSSNGVGNAEGGNRADEYFRKWRHISTSSR